eukprot:9493189-Pyramimonas_sp.AAC.1
MGARDSRGHAMLNTARHRRAKGPRLERGQPLGRRGRPQSSRTSEPPLLRVAQVVGDETPRLLDVRVARAVLKATALAP